MERIKKRDIAKFVSLIILVVAFLIVAIYFNLQGIIEPDKIQEEINSYGSVAPIAYILIFVISLSYFFPDYNYYCFRRYIIWKFLWEYLFNYWCFNWSYYCFLHSQTSWKKIC